MKKPENPIDAFLEGLDLSGLVGNATAQNKPLEDAVRPQQERQGLQVRVMLTGLQNFEYAVHCFVLERGITETDLEGQLLQGQWTFQAESLAKFSERYEAMLEQLNINYHRNPPVPPGPNQDIVSYRLVKRLNDPRGYNLLDVVARATSVLHSNLSQG